ncbi:alpha/beta-Hydrolases superfamily protein [Artemisia annua]|uniref:GPI inositol-deacylase n=1 Tax=Artemisia annua TaxID=35608 RepID=A0A2U1NP17_ARTAN|nr:alpha/beta-Hydrolases superfamily protein [Artemisia annua]
MIALAPFFKPLQSPGNHTLQLPISRRCSVTCFAAAQPESSVTYRPAVILPSWVIDILDLELKSADLNCGSLSIIGHSAGGWLARVYMEEFTQANISLLLTLGSPLQPPPKGLPGVVDQTRGLLTYVEENCKKAVYTPQLRYVCIAGRYIQGSRFLGNSDPATNIPVAIEQSTSDVAIGNDTSAITSGSPTFRTRFVGQGYKQVSIHFQLLDPNTKSD